MNHQVQVVFLFCLVMIGTALACPRYCHCSGKKTDCTKAGLGDLGEDFMEGIAKNTEELILDSNAIKTIPANAFLTLKALKSISIKDNGLLAVDGNAFNGLQNLQNLRFDINKIANIPENLFKNCTKIRSVSYAWNDISLPAISSSFKHTPNLRSLNLSFNDLENEPKIPKDFENLENLTSLSLKRTYLRNLTEDYFSALLNVNLTHLDLSENGRIVAVHPKTLAPLKNLRKLYIGSCDLAVKDTKTLLHGLEGSNLQMLDMQYLMTTDGEDDDRIKEDTFKPLQHTPLKELHLEGNVGGFHGMISGHLFRNFTHLKELYLASNEITTIMKDAFKGLHRLRKLSLSWNLISCGSSCLFLIEGSGKLDHLEELDLSNNVMTLSSPTKFSHGKFPSLKVLDLRNNRISRISSILFAELKGLSKLDISQNPLHQIEPQSFLNLISLKHLNLQESRHLGTLYNATFIGLHHLELLNLSNSHIDALEPGVFSGLRKLEMLDMSHNYLQSSGQFLGIDPVFLPSTKLKLLNLSFNFLENVPKMWLQKQDSLEIIQLDFNKIRQFSMTELEEMSNLTSLNLAYNDISTIQISSINILGSAKNITLEGNPFVCSCDINTLIKWLKHQKPTLTLKQDYHCIGPDKYKGVHLLEYSYDIWECQAKLIVISVLVSPLIFILGVAVTTFYFLKCKKITANQNEQLNTPMVAIQLKNFNSKQTGHNDEQEETEFVRETMVTTENTIHQPLIDAQETFENNHEV